MSDDSIMIKRWALIKVFLFFADGSSLKIRLLLGRNVPENSLTNSTKNQELNKTTPKRDYIKQNLIINKSKDNEPVAFKPKPLNKRLKQTRMKSFGQSQIDHYK